MDGDLVAKARDGRLKALAKLSYRHSIETIVLPMQPCGAPRQPEAATDLRSVFRDDAAPEAPAPRAADQ